MFKLPHATRQIALVLLVIFVTNMGVWAFSAARIAHELQHSLEFSAQVAHQTTALDADEEGGASVVAEHHVLHAVDHIQFFAFAAPRPALALLLANLAPAPFVQRDLPPARFDLPYRPPRTTSPIA